MLAMVRPRNTLLGEGTFMARYSLVADDPSVVDARMEQCGYPEGAGQDPMAATAVAGSIVVEFDELPRGRTVRVGG